MGLTSPHPLERPCDLKRPFVLIACQSVDFFGDAAVCLRLAQGLVLQGAQVRILAEPRALGHLQAMAPDSALEPPHGFNQSSALAYWAMEDLCADDHGHPVQTTDLLLEAFQITTPQAVLNQLSSSTLRYMVDYLALEDWSIDCQWLAAPDPIFSNCARYWVAPSPHAQGPGLIQGSRWAKDGGLCQDERRAVRQRMMQGSRMDTGARLDGHCSNTGDESVFLVFAYCYPSAPLWDFIQALSSALTQATRVVLFQPDEPSNPDTAFLSQKEFDQCMAACDLALVRGEDSFGTALFCAQQWGLPFIWQPYRQPEDAHLVKLEAWLGQAPPFMPEWAELHRYFSPAASPSQSLSSPSGLSEMLRALLSNWPAVQDFCQSLGRAQFARPSFEASLLRHWHAKRLGC